MMIFTTLYPPDKKKSSLSEGSNPIFVFFLYTGLLGEVATSVHVRTEEDFLRVRYLLRDVRVPILAWSFHLR